LYKIDIRKEDIFRIINIETNSKFYLQTNFIDSLKMKNPDLNNLSICENNNNEDKNTGNIKLFIIKKLSQKNLF